MTGVKNTGFPCTNTRFEQCEVEDVFRGEWNVGTRSALRALDGGVLEDVLVVIACDDGDIRLRMQWHGRGGRSRLTQFSILTLSPSHPLTLSPPHPSHPSRSPLIVTVDVDRRVAGSPGRGSGNWISGSPGFAPNQLDMVARRRKILKARSAPSSQPTGRWSDAFMDYLAGECRLAENTIAAYRRDINRFNKWLAGRSIPGLTIADLSDFVAWLHSFKLAPASIARHIVALRMYFRYLQLEGILQDNLAELLGSQKLWQRIPEVLSPAMVTRFLAAPNHDDTFRRRDRALLELLYATGCRASELSNLKLVDVHLDQRFCKCHGKGSKQRLVPLGTKGGGGDPRILGAGAS